MSASVTCVGPCGAAGGGGAATAGAPKSPPYAGAAGAPNRPLHGRIRTANDRARREGSKAISGARGAGQTWACGRDWAVGRAGLCERTHPVVSRVAARTLRVARQLGRERQTGRRQQQQGRRRRDWCRQTDWGLPPGPERQTSRRPALGPVHQRMIRRPPLELEPRQTGSCRPSIQRLRAREPQRGSTSARHRSQVPVHRRTSRQAPAPARRTSRFFGAGEGKHDTHPLGRLGTPVLGSERAAARRRCTAPSTDRTEFRALSRTYGSPPVASTCSGAPPAATADGAPTVRALVPATRRHVVHARRRIRNE